MLGKNWNCKFAFGDFFKKKCYEFFTYLGYVTDVVEDARVYSTHANRKTINIDDVKLAVSQKLDHSFTSPPPREVR